MSQASNEHTRSIAAAEQQSCRRELRVDAMGRFGNFYYAHGWQTVAPSDECAFRYSFHGINASLLPEFSFRYPCEEAVVAYTQATAQVSISARFLHLFYINDGYLVPIARQTPARVSIIDQGEKVVLAEQLVDCVRESDADYFISVLQACQHAPVWQNRLVCEIASTFASDEQLLFHQKAISATGWKSAEPAFLRSLDRNVWPNSTQAKLRFYGHAVSLKTFGKVSPELTERFEQSANDLDHFTPREDLVTAFHGLHKLDPARAFRYARDRIHAQTWTRREIADFLHDCLPANCKWWLRAVLDNGYLGPEQAADALSSAGIAARQGGQPELAALCVEFATRIDAQSQGLFWNQGVTAIESTDFAAAKAAFGRISRHYATDSLTTMWPAIDGYPWPAKAVEMDSFPLPPGASEWPRISVVTPSLNQGAFIEDTILSVLNQGYPNLQYIVVDGGSTDGTLAILERYRKRLDFLIIEPDRGQSEAINKGLKIADGKLLTWLNSDDMLAPGALHMAAFSWKKSEADVIAGICAEHDNRRIGTINKPAARDGDFNTEQLSLIYERWLQGWFFNQPEVFFSKALVEKFGMLDESLEYTMDYDLWLRFAAGGARLAVTDWPFAFFRRHPAQKTHHLLRAIHEQAKVRSRYLKSFPCPANILQTARKLQKLRRKGIVSVAAQGPIHDCELSTPAKAFLQSLIGSTVKIVPASSDWADVVFLVAQEKHADGQPPAAHLESNGQLVIAWFEENLGDPFAAYELACAADIVGGKDESQLDYLRNSKSVFASDLAAHKDALAELI